MSFEETFVVEDVRGHLSRSLEATPERVERALAAAHPSFSDFLALISPAAAEYLEPLAGRAQRVTRERFGKVVRLYAPLYISNECTSRCIYCGFNRDNEVHRVTLSPQEVGAEAQVLWDEGFRDILLVSGEAPREVPVELIAKIAEELGGTFPSVSVEIYPLETEGYAALESAGVEGVTIYQESYDPDLYAKVHLIGALLGLGPWRFEAISLALHGLYLQRKYWRTQLSISFPRIREASGGFAPPAPVSDGEMAQMAFALRLLFPDAGLTLSTRESATFRDGITPVCITAISAGSRTEPGGYTQPGEATEQFAIEDNRTPAEVAQALLDAGLEPVWKDWDRAFMKSSEGRSLGFEAGR